MLSTLLKLSFPMSRAFQTPGVLLGSLVSHVLEDQLPALPKAAEGGRITHPAL